MEDKEKAEYTGVDIENLQRNSNGRENRSFDYRTVASLMSVLARIDRIMGNFFEQLYRFIRL